jgi:bacteriocin biosynthesis cyclodehydratase domain-containing protein
MTYIPAIKSHYRIDILRGEGVLLSSEESTHAFYGRAYELTIPMIDGRRTADQIAAALSIEIDGAEVYYVLLKLESGGYIVESCPDILPECSGFWHALGLTVPDVIHSLESKSVFIHSLDNHDPKPLCRALRSMHIQVVRSDTADFHVVIANDYLRNDLATINKAALQLNRPWLLLRPNGIDIWIGPLFVPGRTGCYRCLAERLRRHRVVDYFVATRTGLTDPPSVALASLATGRETASLLAALETAKFLAGATNGLQGKILTLNLNTWAADLHLLTKYEHCADCGSPAPRPDSSFSFSRKKEGLRLDGGYRSIAPDETFERYRHLISPLTGVVKSLRPMSSSDWFGKVYVAGHNAGLAVENLSFLKRSLRNASSGKGKSEIQAKVSALSEALERYSGEYRGDEPRVQATLQELSDAAVHPNSVMLYSDLQYQEREFRNKRKSKFNNIPEPFDASVRLNWTPLWSMTESRCKYLPTQQLYFGAPSDETSRYNFCQPCSNGMAAGNCEEEAILHAFFELVERDAVALWWYNRLRKPGVTIDSFDDPWLLDLMSHYKERGRDVWALDITNDLNIPVFVALTRRNLGDHEYILFGFGCHLDARIGLQRAFAEMNQMVTLTREDSTSIEIQDEETVWWLNSASLRNQPYLTPSEDLPLRSADANIFECSTDLMDQIALCKSVIERGGMELLILRMTRPDVGMPVVRVVVPGLRHFWARFAPGRLYDVPVHMKWLETPLSETQLNPISMFV